MKKMRGYIIGFICGAVIFSSASVFAKPIQQYILTKISYPVLVNGAEYTNPDLPVLNYEGNTYVPLKAVGDVLGTSVNWNKELKRVEIGETRKEQGFSKVPIDTYKYLDILNLNGKLYEIPHVEVEWMFHDQDGKLFIAIEDLQYISQLFYVINGSYEVTDSNNPYLDGSIMLKETRHGDVFNIDYDNIEKYSINDEMLYSIKKYPLGINKKYVEFTLFNIAKSKEFKASSNPNNPLHVIEHQSVDTLHLISLDEMFNSIGINAEITINDNEDIVYFTFK